MSENDQPQEPLNTQMSAETGGVEIQSNARGDANTELPEWQIFNFADLLNLGELDRYLPVEMQHILALSFALRSILPMFYQAYANAFQDMHIQSTARDPDFRTMSYSPEIFPSMPTPLEDIIKLVELKVQQIKASNRMTGFNFETNTGPIQWASIQPYTNPTEESAWTTTIRRDGEARLERYKAREIEWKRSQQNLRSQFSTSSAEAEAATRAMRESLWATQPSFLNSSQ